MSNTNKIDEINAAGAGEMIVSARLFLRRRLVGISFFLFVSLCLGLIYLIVSPPIFTAGTKVLIEAPGDPLASATLSFGGLGRIDSSQLESEIQIATSEKVAEAVVTTLHLDSNPAFTVCSGGMLTDLLNFLHRRPYAAQDFLPLWRHAP